jgi:hypothetical protein
MICGIDLATRFSGKRRSRGGWGATRRMILIAQFLTSFADPARHMFYALTGAIDAVT